MTARLATVNDRTLAGAENTRDGSSSASDQPPIGGVRFDCGYLSPYFITDPERMEVTLENAFVLIHEKISFRKDLAPLLEQIRKTGKPLLIIAEDIGDEALASLVVNRLSGPMQVAAVRAPSSGDGRKSLLRDLALLTGSAAVTEGIEMQLRDIRISDLGQVRKVTIDKNTMVVECGSRDGGYSCEPEPCPQSNATPLPVQSSRALITRETHGTLSA